MFEQLFTFANPAVYFWLLMMFLPKWRVTKFLANKGVFPFYLALLYTVGIITVIINGGFAFVKDFGSAEGVIQLLSTPDFALLTWIHLLCFDQAIGHYVYQDNMQHRYVALSVQSVLLFATLLFGPFGFLCYLILKTIRKRFKKIV
jgi:hypothetical protein